MSARLLQLRQVPDARGDLVSVDGFAAACVFYFALRADRGAHAHRQATQLLIALDGVFSVRVDDGATASTYQLSTARAEGLLVPPLHWVTLERLSAAPRCLVLASAAHSEADYIRERAEFEHLARFYGLAREYHPEHPAELYSDEPPF